MTITSETPVREIATAIPTAIPVLEQLGIDYCCGGQHTLAEACSTHNIAVARALDELERLQQEQGNSIAASHWLDAPLNELTEHIVQKHHAFTRTQLKLIDDLMAKVEQRHGGEHVEVFQLGKAIAVFGSELRHHAECEEANLFPFIAGLETGQKKDLPAPAKGSVKMPITRMMADHDQTGEELQTLRRLTDNYTPPIYACPTWQALYRAIEELDADLHTHIHLENNILFPRALEKAGAEQQPAAACA